MNLKKNKYRIIDGIEQRSRNAALSLLEGQGLSEGEARSFVANILSSIPNLKDDLRKFLQGIVRWHIQGDLDLNNSRDCSKVNTLLHFIRNSPAMDMYDKNFVSEMSGREESFADVLSVLMLDLEAPDMDTHVSPQGHNYTVIPIESYKQALEYKAVAPDWCILESEEAYNSHTFNGQSKFYFCLRDDYQSVKRTPGPNYPYDNYGYSVIAVCKDADGEISSVTSRWNFDDGHDNFLTRSELKEVLGAAWAKLI